LARLVNLYCKTCANGGTLPGERDILSSSRATVTKTQKAVTCNLIIEHVWGVPFLARYKGAKITKKGLVNVNTPEAVQWNKCKSKLANRVEAG
jgi:hypothetical protein